MRRAILCLSCLFAVSPLYALSSVLLPSIAFAVVWVKGVYHAGCAGPNGAVVSPGG